MSSSVVIELVVEIVIVLAVVVRRIVAKLFQNKTFTRAIIRMAI